MGTLRLSKSKFIAGMQCQKRLYLQVHHPELLEDFKVNMPIILGNEAGDVARSFKKGILISMEDDLEAAIHDTQEVIQKGEHNVIYEATIVHDGVLIRADILERGEEGWHLTEVKSATSCKDYYFYDAAIQAWVLQGSGFPVSSVEIMHINKQFVYQGDGSYDGLFCKVDVTRQSEELKDEIGRIKDTFIRMLEGPIPEIQMGDQCKSPYECEFLSHCSQGGPEYPVSILPRGGNVIRSLQADGIEDVRDIPEGHLKNPKHELVRRVTVSGVAELSTKASEELAALGWPRYYLDFETIGFAVPRWAGTGPYRQIPFQWSCHIQNASGEIEHAEYLNVTGEDPRREFAEKLIECCGTEGSIIVYNATFEKGRIKELADVFPDIAPLLLSLNERMFDLLPVARKYYYHPAMRGSWSIKAVLPTVVPELNYGDLESVQHGMDAQLAYMKLTSQEAEDDESKQLKEGLYEYCKMDTLAMMKMAEVFQQSEKSEK